MDNKVLNTFTSSTGGTVQVFSWGLRHTAGKPYGGEKSEYDVKDDQVVTYSVNTNQKD